jgi:signal transduction histidine kinase
VLAGNNEKSAYIEIYSKPIIYRKGKAILALIRDITTRKETEKNLLYTVVNTEEKERQRFARDLHDELGPFLSGLKLYLHELQVPGATNEQRKIMIGYLTEMTDEAVEKVRMIASNMAPQNMIDIGLTESVKTMIYKLNQTGRINIDLISKGNEEKLEPSFVITLYRIILELINNSLKHGESSHIDIRLVYKKKLTYLKYTDDGKGFDLKKELNNNKGIGLKSILSRITLYQGNYKFSRVNPKGIQFEINFPVK